HPEQYAVFAGVLPEDKYKLVKAFQNGGHTVGMCGDGANDAPALRQAQMGIAVSTATDVAKSAAGMVLTEPGLAGIVAAVKEGRVIFQRILTYTLNSITKKVVQVLFPGGRLDPDRTRDPDAVADGPDYGHRRFPGHVVDNRQCTALPGTERLAHWQSDARRHRHWDRGVGILYGDLVYRRLSNGIRYRDAADTGVCRHRVRQSGHDLRQSGPPAPVVDLSQYLAHGLVDRRSRDRGGLGHWRHPDEAFADRCRSRDPRGGSRFHVRAGTRKGSDFPTPKDRLGDVETRPNRADEIHSALRFDDHLERPRFRGMRKSFIGIENAVELEAMGNQELGVELAGSQQVEQHRRADGVDQARRDGDVAVPQALEMESHLGSMHADIGDGAARGDDLFAQFEGRRNAHRLDGGVDPARAGHLHDGLRGLAVRAIDGRGRAEAPCHVEAAIVEIDHDD